jgi:cytochrome c5
MSSNLRKAVLISAVTVGIAAAAVVMAAAPQASGFPDGPGKAIVEGNCGSCHDLDLVKQAKHDEKAWTETIGHMVNYGAAVTDAQVPTLAAYLAKAFPVAGAPKADDKPKEDPDVVGERILNTACTTCHDLGPVTRRADDKASWEGVVYGMVGNGADVKDAEIPILVDYLVKHYGPPKDAPAATPAAPARGGARGGAGR